MGRKKFDISLLVRGLNGRAKKIGRGFDFRLGVSGLFSRDIEGLEFMKNNLQVSNICTAKVLRAWKLEQATNGC